jgi:hypothetical protein
MYRQKVDSTRCGKKQRSVYALGHCGTFRITLEHWENTQKFGSCPLRFCQWAEKPIGKRESRYEKVESRFSRPTRSC